MNSSKIVRWLVLSSIIALFVSTPSALQAQVVRQLTDIKTGTSSVPAIDSTATDVYVSSSTNQLGGNASHAFQLVRFTASSGAGAQLTTATDGISNDRFVVSVSNDDQWVAFVSRDNPTGQNLDRSGEVFVVAHDGTGLQQITNHPGAGLGDALMVAMAGNGTKVAFTSTGNLTGSNAGHVQQVFLVNRDGTGLTQVTALTDGEIYFLKISDDATKIVFGAEADPLGTNADDNVEIFAIAANGTGLKQLTSTTDANGSSGTPSVAWVSFAGGGSKVAFAGYGDPVGQNSDHSSEVFIVDYAGTNLKQLTNSTAPGPTHPPRDSEYPAITADGATVYYTSDQFTTTVNRDGSFELWKINSDGTANTLVTNNGIEYVNLVVSGSGNRLAFNDINGDGETKVIDSTGANLRSLTSTTRYPATYATISGAGDVITFESTADLVTGGNTGHTEELFLMHADGSGLAQLTSGMSVDTPTMAGNGGSAVFLSFADPFGTNASHSGQLFRVNTDGTGLTQVTHGTNGYVYLPRSSRDGSISVFSSNMDLTGQNPDHSYEEFRVNADGSGLVQLTNSSDPNSLSAANGIDDAGIWVAFQSNANLDGTHPLGVSDIWRVRADGSGLQALTSGAAGYSSDYADISGDGSAVCFNSTQDFTGGNPDHNGEIFLWTSSGIRQLTSTTDGYCYYPRLSRDGHWVYFLSSAPIFEANPGTANRLYRVNVSSGSVERADGLGFEAPYYSPAGGEDGINIPSVDDTGIRAVHAQSVNSTRSNPDFFQEVFLYDYTKAPAITVSSGPAPTRVSWDVETGPVRYDVIRGDTANLSINGSSVNLGAVQCVKNDSPVNSTESSDDGLTPAPGHVFFYVYRGSQGLSAGPGSYGQGTGGKERLAGSGDCQP